MSVVTEPQTPTRRSSSARVPPETPRSRAMGNRVVCATPHKGRALINYSLGDRLGRGAFATVYKAIHLRTGEFAAIKQIPLEKIKSVDSIMGEIELLQDLQHPNIVKYLGFMKDDFNLSIVLEYCENGSLAMILHKFGSFPENLIARYMRQVLDGLSYLHRQGTIHRDIKGGNILTTKDGVAKLADFGVATRIQPENEEPAARPGAVGTPHWMAPEIIQMQEPSTSCDIWSLGATVVELRTGQPPYGNRADIAAMYAIVQQDSPAMIPADVSGSLRDFLTLCFEKDPSLRVSAEDLLRHHWIRKFGGGAVSHPEEAVREWNSPSRRRKLAVPSVLNLRAVSTAGATSAPSMFLPRRTEPEDYQEDFEDDFASLGVFGYQKSDVEAPPRAEPQRQPLGAFIEEASEQYDDDYDFSTRSGTPDHTQSLPTRVRASDSIDSRDPFAGLEDLLEDAPDQAILCAQEEAKEFAHLVGPYAQDLTVIFRRLAELTASVPAVRKIVAQLRTLSKALSLLTTGSPSRPTVLAFIELVEICVADDPHNDAVTSFCLAGGLSFLLAQSNACSSSILRILYKISCRDQPEDGIMAIARQLAFREDAVAFLCSFFTVKNESSDVLRASSVILEMFRLCGPRHRSDLWHHFNSHSLFVRLVDLLHLDYIVEDEDRNPLTANLYNLLTSFSRTPQESLVENIDQRVLRRLMRAYITLPLGSAHRITILEFFKTVSTLVPVLEAMQRGNVAPHVIAALRRAMHDPRVPSQEAYAAAKSLVPTLFNYARIERSRQREVAKFGLLPLLKDCIQRYSKLREFAFPIFTAMAHSAHPECLRALGEADGLSIFTHLMTESGWQAMAIAALAAWMVEEPELVRPRFAPHAAVINESLSSTSGTTFESVLSAVASLLDRNRLLCRDLPSFELFKLLRGYVASQTIGSSASLVQALQIVTWMLAANARLAQKSLLESGLLDTVTALRDAPDIPVPCIKLIGQIYSMAGTK